MRLLGVLLLAAGVAGTVAALPRALSEKRPRDVGFALLAPMAVVVAVLGLVLALVPGFLD